jgi:hypothetical protein
MRLLERLRARFSNRITTDPKPAAKDSNPIDRDDVLAAAFLGLTFTACALDDGKISTDDWARIEVAYEAFKKARKE